MSRSFEYLNKTVFYLKASPDNFYYLGVIDVYAVNEKYLFDKDFKKCISIDSIFETVDEAQNYMGKMGIQLYLGPDKIGFKKIAAADSDVIL